MFVVARRRARQVCYRSMATLTSHQAAASFSPAVVVPSAQEIRNSALDDRNLEKAVRHVHRDGLVVINDVVPHEHLDHLNARMVDDARKLQARGENGPFNYNLGNLQQDAPPFAEFFQPSIFTSKFHPADTQSPQF